MELTQFNKVNALCSALFKKHLLDKNEWTFSFSEMSTFSSKTEHHIKNIKISKLYIISKQVNDSDILNTILNEISRALVSQKHKSTREFNKAWKKKCEEIGGTPQSTCDPFVDKEYFKFHLTCEDGCFIGKMRVSKGNMKFGCFECVKHGKPLKCEKNKSVKKLNF